MEELDAVTRDFYHQGSRTFAARCSERFVADLFQPRRVLGTSAESVAREVTSLPIHGHLEGADAERASAGIGRIPGAPRS